MRDGSAVVLARWARLYRSEERAVLRGFDHFRAWETSLVGAIVFLGVAVLLAMGSRFAEAGVALLAAPLLFALTRLLGFTLTLTTDTGTLDHSFAGIRYQRRALRSPLRCQLWGTGDGGLEGDWPIAQFCEVEEEGRCTETRVGPAWAAGEICRALNAELARLRPGVEVGWARTEATPAD